MITRWTGTFLRLRRLLSPTEWFVRWFRLPRAEALAEERGLVLVQIDGLSRKQLMKGIHEGRMPFLKSLLAREHYRIRDLYSGVPSTTPSVQGELFYGVRCAVPAFGFRDHRTGEIVRMFSRDVAFGVEQRLQERDMGLLADGSAYCNVYSGGAREVHFCASSLGWDELIKVQPWKLTLFLLWHCVSVVRTVGLMLVEFFLAIAGFFQGTLTGREYIQEVLLIPARVVVVVLMRELATVGASLDVTRGVPVVHLNLLGFDEHAHRRGPESRFAHWTLRGIDRAIRRLWRAAHRSAGREYDVWIFSDHGQESTIPYEYIAGKRLGQAAQEAVNKVCGDGGENRTCAVGTLKGRKRDASANRAGWLGASWIIGKLFGDDTSSKTDPSNQRSVQVAALGPLGLIYSNRKLSDGDRLLIAEELVCEHSVPVAYVSNQDSVTAVTRDGRFDLKSEPQQVFGSNHPFLGDVAEDMVLLCRHADAGDVVVSGWRCDADPVSFATQNGAHAGPGVEETSAFLMLSCDVPVHDNGKSYLRPDDLRQTVQQFLNSPTSHAALSADDDASSAGEFTALRVLTYNVHTCVGMDARLSPKRIARVIAQSGAEIVALQELDVFRLRTGQRDQAEEIARLLRMEYHFHPVWNVAEELYGDAILSRWPMKLIRKGQLPAQNSTREPRGAVWVEVKLRNDQAIQVINTHLSIYPGERKLQSQAIANDWAAAAMKVGPTVVCGDFNAQPRSQSYQLIRRLLRDAQTYSDDAKPAATWYSPRPLVRIDHIFITNDLRVESSRVLTSRLARVASDHLPLVADLRLPGTPSLLPEQICRHEMQRGEESCI